MEKSLKNVVKDNYPAITSLVSKLGPGLIGCSLGLIASTRIKKKLRKPTAYGILIAGLSALTPGTYGMVKNAINSSTSPKANKRKLENIRSASEPYIEEEDFMINSDYN